MPYIDPELIIKINEIETFSVCRRVQELLDLRWQQIVQEYIEAMIRNHHEKVEKSS